MTELDNLQDELEARIQSIIEKLDEAQKKLFIINKWMRRFRLEKGYNKNDQRDVVKSKNITNIQLNKETQEYGEAIKKLTQLQEQRQKLIAEREKLNEPKRKMSILKNELLILENKMSGSQNKKAQIALKCSKSKTILESLKKDIIRLKIRKDKVVKWRDDRYNKIIEAKKEINKI